MCEIFGNFVDMDKHKEYVGISFSPSTLSILELWRNNSISANFLADYSEAFFPVHDHSSQQRQAEVRDTVSYIANELLENAVKFSTRTEVYPIHIGLYLSHDELTFYMTNSAKPTVVSLFQNFIRRLLTENPDDLYVHQLESHVDNGTDAEPRLGFLIMLNDYDAHLAWRFEMIPQYPEIIAATTMVQVKIEKR